MLKLRKFENSIGFTRTHHTQLQLEKTILNQFELYSSGKNALINNISSRFLGGVVKKFIFDQNAILDKYINTMKNGLSTNIEKRFMADILETVGFDYIKSLLYVRFLQVLTYKDSDEDNQISLTSVTLSMGNECIKKYLHIVVKPIRESEGVNFSEALYQWFEKHPDIKTIINDDTFVSKLGGKFVDVLESANFLKKVLVTKSRTEKVWVVEISDDNIIKTASSSNERSFLCL